MKLSACITTRNRTKELDACLQALWSSTVEPHSVVVSDDSSDETVQQQNREVVEKYPGTKYILGPQAGVCANRNNAVNAIPSSETDLVCFIDDDICVEPDFIGCALEQYNQMSAEKSSHTILSGVSIDINGHESSPVKLSFRGYFCSADTPEAVAIHATIFPHSFFRDEQWDENIFFGYEDAELSLRAIKRGYKITFCSALRTRNTGSTQGTLLMEDRIFHQSCIEAARLYVGVKRYKYIFPNSFKLVTFLSIYFSHITLMLIKQNRLFILPSIIKRSALFLLF